MLSISCSSEYQKRQIKLICRLLVLMMSEGSICIVEHSDILSSFTCPICRAPYNDKLILNNHYAGAHSDKPYRCASCSVSYLSRRSLISHVRAKHSPGLRKTDECYCFSCEIMFSKEADMKCHDKIFHASLPLPVIVPLPQYETYRCSYCHWEGLNEKHYKHHIASHLGGEDD